MNRHRHRSEIPREIRGHPELDRRREKDRRDEERRCHGQLGGRRGELLGVLGHEQGLLAAVPAGVELGRRQGQGDLPARLQQRQNTARGFPEVTDAAVVCNRSIGAHFPM